MRRIYEIDAPAHWATLIAYGYEGDGSDLTEDEMFECEKWLKDNGLAMANLSDVSQNDYFGQFDFPLQGPLMCTLVTYTFMTEGDAS